ncbi:MAG TPA: hypothetical protein VEC12_14950 [Bacteroidia bacterium]|nr:hypothetical protein [Bacteroidia bacterium]
MDTLQLKKQLHEYIEHADTRVLNMIYAMLQADNSQVVAYTTDGKPLTLEQYNEELEAAETQLKQGRVLTHDQVKAKVAQWTKKN